MGSPQIVHPPYGHKVEWGDNCILISPSNVYRCKIRSGVRIGPFSEIQEGCDIGEDTVICSHVFLAGGTKVGARCFIGHGVVTCNDRYPVANNTDWKKEIVVIGDAVSIGSGAIILPGVTIGDRARIGAGAIVTKDILADHTFYSESLGRIVPNA